MPLFIIILSNLYINRLRKKNMFYAEKEAGEFLKKNGFPVLDRYFIERVSDLDKIPYPCVMKVGGRKINHKNRIGGVVLNVEDKDSAISTCKKLMKKKDAEFVVAQMRIYCNNEFLLGIKKTPEFGHVIVFGNGGSGVEEKNDVSFRVYPLSASDAEDMINNTDISKNITTDERKVLLKLILKLSTLIKKNPKILELDINPLMDGKVVDSRIVFSD